MAAWPDYVRIEADGMELRAGESTARTPMDDGAVVQHRRYGAALESRRVTGWVDDADLTRFRAWAAADAHKWFTWHDESARARTVRVRDGEAGIALTARIGADGRRAWDIALELEGWP